MANGTQFATTWPLVRLPLPEPDPLATVISTYSTDFT